MASGRVAHGLRDPKVGDYRVVAPEQDVIRLDVPMHDAARVGLGERVGNFSHGSDNIRDGQLVLARDPLAQRLAIDERHAVEEALCFGWIDSIVKRMDDQKFAQKFTPRRDGSRWSALNTRRVRKLIQEGRMTEVGLAKVDAAILSDKARAIPGDSDVDLPLFIKQALMSNATAWKNFRSLSPSRRNAYVRLITDAKKEETRDRRLREVISRLEQNTGDPDDLPRSMPPE